MEVLAAGEGREHPLVARELCRDAQLDLRVVGLDQHPALPRPEAGPVARVAGDVLQVRPRAGHPTRSGADLPPVGVDATGEGVDEA
jgi:hypothetical protein